MGRNMLVDGEWRTDVEPYTNDDGEFDRVETAFRNWIRDDPDARFQPEADRYHLYVARNCPWAHGAALTRRLLGLTDIVSMDVVDPIREDEGWEFTPEKDGCTQDTVNGTDYLREVYAKADPEFTGRVTVPDLWDTEEETIVNNESIEIMRMFATAFGPHGGADDTDLYPEGEREEIDRIVDDLYDSFNNGVYRAGFAESQEAYEDAVEDVFDALDHWDSVLADQRYLAGDQLTLTDVRMYPTLVRFDQVYHTAFKCDKQFLHQYENLWPYLRDLYQTPGVPKRSEGTPNERTGNEATRESPFAETTKMAHIKQGYYAGELVAVGPDLDYDAPHDRARLADEPVTGAAGD